MIIFVNTTQRNHSYGDIVAIQIITTFYEKNDESVRNNQEWPLQVAIASRDIFI